MIRIIKKIKKYYLEDGFIGLINRIISAITHKIFAPDVHVVAFSSLDQLKNYTSSKKLEISLLEKKHLSAFREFNQNNYTHLKHKKVLDYHLQNGFKCYLATLNGEIIGYNWCTDNQIPPIKNHPHLLRYGIKLGDKEAYGFDFYISPKHRGGGNSVEFYTKMKFKLKDHSYQKLYGVVEGSNKKARWLYRLMGQKEIRQFKTYQIFNLFLIVNKKIYIKSNRFISSQPFDYIPLFPYSI